MWAAVAAAFNDARSPERRRVVHLGRAKWAWYLFCFGQLGVAWLTQNSVIAIPLVLVSIFLLPFVGSTYISNRQFVAMRQRIFQACEEVNASLLSDGVQARIEITHSTYREGKRTHLIENFDVKFEVSQAFNRGGSEYN